MDQGPESAGDAIAVEDTFLGRCDVALVGGGGWHRLLLCVRSGPRPGDRRLSPDHGNGANAATLGLWIVAEPGTLQDRAGAVSYTHLRAHETVLDLVCRL